MFVWKRPKINQRGLRWSIKKTLQLCFGWTISSLKESSRPFSVYFLSFRKSGHAVLQQMNVKNEPSNIRFWDSNSQPLMHESSPITNRPLDSRTTVARLYYKMLLRADDSIVPFQFSTGANWSLMTWSWEVQKKFSFRSTLVWCTATKNNMWRTVWPEKNRQMSIKVAQKLFHKIKW